MFGMGQWEILIILLIALLVFGAKRIPEMAQGLGRGIREFRKAMHEVQDEISVDSTPPAANAGRKLEASAPPQSVPQEQQTQPEGQQSSTEAPPKAAP